MTIYTEIPKSIETFIEEIKDLCGEEHKNWADVFENVFSNTLLTTVKRISKDETFVLTGDIPAMWLRDSTAQVRPYLVVAQDDPGIANMIRGLINRQIMYVNHEPYANAFNETYNSHGYQDDDTLMTPLIWERKYEIDSLCYPIQLSYLYYKATKDTSIFNEEYVLAVKRILNLWTVEQNHETDSPYRFTRDTERVEDTLSRNGKGSEVAYTGMTWSGFRPSDDACIYGYLVPSNMFAHVVLGYIQEIFADVLSDQDIVKRANQLAKEIKQGIDTYGIIKKDSGAVYAYEVDGFGNQTMMDDPNVPSLLSAAYLGYCDADDEMYQSTRSMILSKENPYYYEGTESRGCGSSHTPQGYIWPIALSIEGLTTQDKNHKKFILDNLVKNDGGTKMMHESFHVDKPTEYTREWFSWANMMFCELVMDYFDIRVPR